MSETLVEVLAQEETRPGRRETTRTPPPEPGKGPDGPEPEARGPLYAPRAEVYPKAVSGRYRRLKTRVLIALLAVYYLAPWIRWDRGANAPDQAILADIPGRRAYFFFIELWPQEVYFFTGLLILAALALFFMTSLAGRVWCGYACPQTVWTDLYMWVERRIEGDRNRRMRLDRAPWSPAKAARKLTKHAAWIVIALLTGGAWVFYFRDAPTLAAELLRFEASTTVYATIGLLTATTYLLAGWAREQVCTYMCPYARFQGAMLDEHSLIVTYDPNRGEPRGKHKKGEPWEGRGHCIDCEQCVVVCPTGIDIRDGLQMECIGCGLCADACDTIMDRVGLPRGLIRFDTLANLEAERKGAPRRFRLVRPRTVVYGLLILVVALVMVGGLVLRSDTEINVLRDRNPLFVTLSDGSIRNGYTFKVLNKTLEPHSYRLTLAGLEGFGMTVLGRTDEPVREVTLEVGPDSVGAFRVFVRAPRAAIAGGSAPLTFVITNRDTGKQTTYETRFSGPEKT